MPIPDVYSPGGENVVANYNYVDVAEGTGRITFYGSKHYDTTLAGVSGCYLTTQTTYAERCYTMALVTSGAFMKDLDLDFDVVFNAPKRMKGNVYATYTLGNGATGASSQSESFAVIKLRKVSDGTESEIASSSGSLMFNSASTEIEWRTECTRIPVNTLAHFKKGDTFRATFEIWAKKDSTNTGETYILHDPKNRIDTTSVPQTASYAPLTSQLILDVPFILDL